MAQPLTYKKMAKSYKIKTKKLIELEEHMDSLESVSTDTKRHLLAHEAVLECFTLLLQQEKFICIAQEIYRKCKDILGTTSGYVALVEHSGKCLDVIHLDTGGQQCTITYESPMPIRGLRRETLQKGITLCCNNFRTSKWLKFLPKGHVQLHNVLFAPMVIEEVPVGLLGFANKPKDFDQDDMRIATSFAKLTALALSNSKAWHVMKKTGLHKVA